MRIVALCRNEAEEKELRAVLQPCNSQAEFVSLSGRDKLPWARVFDGLAEDLSRVLLDDKAEAGVGRVAVVVNRIDLTGVSPQKNSWDAVFGRLILAFPEIWWLFVSVLDEAEYKDLQSVHSVTALWPGTTIDPLFDGAGLRNIVRGKARHADGTDARVINYIPLRRMMAAALDDEVSYAYFNAYTAYRFGFLAYPLHRWAGAESLLHGNSKRSEPYLTFEDLFLNYPDNQPNSHLSDLGSDDENGRKTLLQKLQNASYRIFVTTEHRHAGDGEKFRRNRVYIRSGECVAAGAESNRYGRFVLKPYSGMYALWERSGLTRHLTGKDGARRGMAPGFVWPPKKSDGHDGDTGHSAPGGLLQVATHMLGRCERILKAGVHNVPDAVRCAVLATDALELLGDRTPTTAMDALVLKHVAEVTAECQFSGVEYNIEVRPRLKEIRQHARSLSRWFNPRRQAMAAMNAEMTTLIELMRVFRQYGQFAEALRCQNRVRYLHNRLWMRQKPTRIIFWPVLKYAELVLASFGCFLAAIAGWFLLFAGLFTWADKRPDIPVVVGPWEQAFTAFTGANGFTSGSFFWNALTVCAVLIGIAHIGIFISHVYMLVSRKD